ncbi:MULTISPECIES: 2-oxoacid:acceptor oxidoreductase subunit alpha [unclassified Gemella]|uniref:2-oxoacid:acceptor oxidoreductase subunit alpha n=1 Tax=unclassified Gemella TaxID=2624949 RepID=UPI001C055930|nr:MULTISPECIES: 2-oxoacid:acceptor oxidoreductase subunit alpha [unclassified Gemella]MBU0278296.1 2-oxoacid:acceptor oxidoreductase subunit alpha [Gemella sp. zg-1178]QWQ38198.1 2-oxoacid:acceptor oxidoreductase subunit alpha [Gemella sp. zg-570]
MINKLSWKIGGEQGEGLESTAEIFSTVINSLGYNMYSTRNFSSRIKGGHSTSKICINEIKKQSIEYKTDILLAFDQATLENYIDELHDNSIIIVDDNIKPIIPENIFCRVAVFPITKLAKEISSPIIKNLITLGICSKLLNIETNLFLEMIENKFSSKGQDVVESNIKAFEVGREIMTEYVEKNNITDEYYLKVLHKKEKNNMWLIGNHAAAIGALAAGCRVYAGYPITPATEVMEYMFENLSKFGGAYIQTEDELAALGVVLGAGYAGARAMTATSGPGMALMTEFLGLATISEQPVVIYDAQRGGPATGLPTKIEQSDIFHSVYGGAGDASRIVLAPTSVEDSFNIMIEAFNLAEVYQSPVVVLSDLQLSMNKETVKYFNFSNVEINRGKLLTEEEIAELENTVYFKRYDLEDLVSNRAIPGQIGGIHNANSSEHSEYGLPSENPIIRQKQTEKRMKKVALAFAKEPFVYKNYDNENNILLIGINSVCGTIDEVSSLLKEKNISVDTLHIRQIFPVSSKIEDIINKYKNVYVVEHNYNAQLKTILEANLDLAKKLNSIRKYNGDIFYCHEIIEEITREENRWLH